MGLPACVHAVGVFPRPLQVVTLTKDEIRDRVPDPGDEQLHVLPLYYLDNTDELGSVEGQQEKVRRGSIEVLTHYRHKQRLH